MIDLVPGCSVFVKNIRLVKYNRFYQRFEAYLKNGELWSISKSTFQTLVQVYHVKHVKSRFLKEA